MTASLASGIRWPRHTGNASERLIKMKALRPVASRLSLRSSTARRRKPLGKRNATARAVEGNLGGFCLWPDMRTETAPARAACRGRCVGTPSWGTSGEGWLARPFRAAKRRLMHRSKFGGFRPVTRRVQPGCRSRYAVSRSRSAWSGAPQRHSQAPGAWSPHRRRQ
jgi:hypothetical protein